MASKVEICGVNTSKLPRYRDREMQEMLEAIKAGDERMRDEFIRGNLRLVLSVIQKFSARGENPDDLFQVGCVGLIKALNNFDLSHGVKFSTYAVPMIVGEVRRYLRDNNSIRVSRSVRDTAYRALTAREHLGRQLQREPTVDEIARELELYQPAPQAEKPPAEHKKQCHVEKIDKTGAGKARVPQHHKHDADAAHTI